MTSPYRSNASAFIFATSENVETLDVSSELTLTGVLPRALSVGNTSAAGITLVVRAVGATADTTWVCAGGAETYIPAVVEIIRANTSHASLQVKGLY